MSTPVSPSPERRTGLDKLAELKAQEKRRRQRMWGLISVGVLSIAILATVGIMALVSAAQKDSPQSSSFVPTVTHIPESSFAAAGYVNSTTAPTKTASGKIHPHTPINITYYGGQYCPYCAMERWSMVAALSRFGTWSGLKGMISSEGKIPTIDWMHAHYSSPYVHLTSYEMTDQNHKPLQTPPRAAREAFVKYNSTKFFPGVSPGGIPFVNYDNTYASSGATYNASAQMMSLKTGDIETALKHPTSQIGSQILGAANLLTAQICHQDGGKPANVCQAPSVRAAAAHIHQ